MRLLASYLALASLLISCFASPPSPPSENLGIGKTLCGRFAPQWLTANREGHTVFETSLKFGTEIEFPLKNPRDLNPSSDGYEASILRLCQQCQKDSQIDSCQLTGQNLRVKIGAHHLDILTGYDPGVLEIRTQPLTYAETRAWSEIMDTLIFGAAKAMGNRLLDPQEERNRWSGHLNVSWPDLDRALDDTSSQDPALATSMRLLLNFYVDLQNHPELAMGVLGGDTRNAAPLAFGNEAERQSLAKIVQHFAKGGYHSIFGLAMALTGVSPHSFGPRYGFPSRSHRYNLINMENIGTRWGKGSGSRLEIRGFFTPLNSGDMLANYRIVMKRLEYLRTKSSNRLVAYDTKRHIESDYKTSGLQKGITLDQAAEAYISYLREAGLDPRSESKYLRDPAVKKEVRRRTGGWCL